MCACVCVCANNSPTMDGYLKKKGQKGNIWLQRFFACSCACHCDAFGARLPLPVSPYIFSPPLVPVCVRGLHCIGGFLDAVRFQFLVYFEKEAQAAIGVQPTGGLNLLRTTGNVKFTEKNDNCNSIIIHFTGGTHLELQARTRLAAEQWLKVSACFLFRQLISVDRLCLRLVPNDRV